MALAKGTYLREPDGAKHLFHSPFFYGDAALAFKVHRPDFKIVFDTGTQGEVKEHFGGDLKPGEYGEIRFP